MRQRPTSRTQWILLWGGFLLGSVAVLARVPAIMDEPSAGDDFTQDYVSSRAWRDGGDPYQELDVLVERHAGIELVPSWPEGQRNPHPPAQVVSFVALSWMPYRIARLAWLGAMALLFATGVSLTLRQLKLRPVVAGAIGTASLMLPIVQRDLAYGQMGGLFVFLFAFSWSRLRVARSHSAGIAWGIAVAFKLFPALLVIPFLRGRTHRSVIMGLVTAASFTLIGVAATGWGQFDRWLTQVSPENLRYWGTSPISFSLPSFPLRWLIDNPWHSSAHNHSFLAVGVVVLIIGAGMVAAATTPSRRSGDPFLAALPLMVLVSPMAGDLTLPLLLPTLAAILVRFWRASRTFPIPLMIAFMILVVGAPPWLSDPQPNPSMLVLLAGYALPAYALLILAVSEWGRALDGRARTAGRSAKGIAASRMRSFG